MCSSDLAVLMADIIGYTALTERYSRHPEGVEQLKTQLNDFFGRLNSVIFGHGGDIISFAGDSVFAVWRDSGEHAAVRSAAQCALEAQRTLDRSDLGESLMLRMRIVIVAVGHRQPAWVNEAFNDYARRMPYAARIELIEVKPEPRISGKTPMQLMQAEAQRIQIGRAHV